MEVCIKRNIWLMGREIKIVAFVLVTLVRRTMSSIDVGLLEDLRYEYKGA